MRHFSLNHLFSFVAACCIYFATLRIVFLTEGSVIWAMLLVGAWIAMGVIYLYWRLKRRALAVHWLGPVSICVLVIFDSIQEKGILFDFAIETFAIGCALSTVMGFPIICRTIVGRSIRKLDSVINTSESARDSH